MLGWYRHFVRPAQHWYIGLSRVLIPYALWYQSIFKYDISGMLYIIERYGMGMQWYEHMSL